MLFFSKTMIFNRKHKICLVKQWFLTSHIPTFQHSNIPTICKPGTKKGKELPQIVGMLECWNVGGQKPYRLLSKSWNFCHIPTFTKQKLWFLQKHMLLLSKSWNFCHIPTFFIEKSWNY